MSEGGGGERRERAKEELPVLDDAERERRSRKIVRAMLVGGIAFLAIVVLGLIPELAGKLSPALGEEAALALWFLAPAIPLALLAVAVLMFRRR